MLSRRLHPSKGQLVDVEGRLQTRQWDDEAGKRQSKSVARDLITELGRQLALDRRVRTNPEAALSKGQAPLGVYELAFSPASIQPVRCCGSAVAQCRSSYPLCLSVNRAPVAQRISS